MLSNQFEAFAVGDLVPLRGKGRTQGVRHSFGVAEVAHSFNLKFAGCTIRSCHLYELRLSAGGPFFHSTIRLEIKLAMNAAHALIAIRTNTPYGSCSERGTPK